MARVGRNTYHVDEGVDDKTYYHPRGRGVEDYRVGVDNFMGARHWSRSVCMTKVYEHDETSVCTCSSVLSISHRTIV